MEFSRPEYSVLGSLFLLWEFFPTQGSNPGLPHYKWILYQLSHKESPRTLEWVAYPFSSQTSWPRNWTWVSCIAGRFFTNWAIREEVLFLETIIKVRWAAEVVCILFILLFKIFQRHVFQGWGVIKLRIFTSSKRTYFYKARSSFLSVMTVKNAVTTITSVSLIWFLLKWKQFYYYYLAALVQFSAQWKGQITS